MTSRRSRARARLRRSPGPATVNSLPAIPGALIPRHGRLNCAGRKAMTC